MVRYWIVLATVRHILRDRRFQQSVIMGAIAVVALGQLGRDNQARPVRRAAAWYKTHGISHELALVREALEPGKEKE
jgi:hypothetical protein